MPSIKSIPIVINPKISGGDVLIWNDKTHQFEGQKIASLTSVVYDNEASGFDIDYESGYFCYIFGNNILLKTDSSEVASSKCVGATTVNRGELLFSGFVENARFINSCPIPQPGYPVYLARADDEEGSAGKLRSSPPISGVMAEVGVCLSNENFHINKTCKILLRIRDIIVL